MKQEYRFEAREEEGGGVLRYEVTQDCQGEETMYGIWCCLEDKVGTVLEENRVEDVSPDSRLVHRLAHWMGEQGCHPVHLWDVLADMAQ